MFRALARPLLASWFVYEGVQNVLEPERHAGLIAPTVEPTLTELGVEEVKAADVVKVHGVLTVAAASALALSRSPRSSALALAGLAGAAAYFSHPFWKETDPARREAELDLFLKDLSLVGGVLVAATAGHSARHVARQKAKKVRAKDKAVEAKARAKAAKSKKRAA